jgi:riboflavin kinase
VPGKFTGIHTGIQKHQTFYIFSPIYEMYLKIDVVAKKMGGDIIFSLRKLALLGAIEQPIKLSSGHFAEGIGSSVQTAARRLQELEREGLVHRRIIADGQWIMLTTKGVEFLKKECYEYQELFFSTPKIEVEIAGRLVTGLGEGGYYTTLNGYKKQFEAKLGFIPFPGTLNLSLDLLCIVARKKLDGRKGITIERFESENRTFGGGKCFPCKILNERAEGIKSAVILPDRTHYPDDILEIISPVYLRGELDLKNGDEVRTRVVI